MYFVLQSPTAAILDPGRQHRLQRLPAACRRSWPGTATCPASSPTGATGSCSRTASSCWRRRPAVLIIVFGGVTTALIPLYAVGVFTGFTLSQAGMVRHHQRLREPQLADARPSINAVGAVATGIVALVVVVSKFTIGAWIPAVADPDHRGRAARPSTATTSGCSGAWPCPPSYRPRPAHPHRRGARRPGPPGRAGRAHLRPVARPRPPHRASGRERAGGARADPASSGSGTTSTSSCRRSTRPTGSSPRR